MFTDVVGFTPLAQEDEAGALRLVKEQAELVHAALPRHHGREVKALGDGLLLEFPSALDAIECAVEIQRRLSERQEREGAPPLTLRVGIHLGDVQGHGADILGDAVNIASRIESLAEPGGICLSAQVYDQIRTKVPHRLEALGPRTLKGVRAPLEVYRVVLPWKQPGEGPGKGPSLPRLAVLPFANISPDPSDEYFAEGLTEELISVLSKLKGLRVIARTSVSPYKATPKPVRQIGTELGVQAVLEGSVRKAGNRLRIALQLIDAGNEEHRWAETYDRELTDVFAIQTDVAERTAEALRLELLRDDRTAIEQRPTTNPEAYELYLKGVAMFERSANEGWTRRGAEEAARYFELALTKDPNYAPTYANFANLLIGVMEEAIPARELVPRARELVARALELDPGSSEAHSARGNFALQVERDWVRAESEFQKAVLLNPSSMPAHGWYGMLLRVLQRYPESDREYAAAIELDPLFRQLLLLRIRNLASAGNLTRALELLDEALRSDPEDERAHLARAVLLVYGGRTEEARRELDQAPGPFSDAASAAEHAEVLAWLGEPDEARALVRESEGPHPSRFVRPTIVAKVLCVLGEPTKALDLIERDLRTGVSALWIDYDSVAFNPVRSSPRFVSWLEELRLPTTPPGSARFLPG